MNKNYEKPIIEEVAVEIEDIMATSSKTIGEELLGDVKEVFFGVAEGLFIDRAAEHGDDLI